MAFELSGVRRVVEGMLDDRLQIWRDAEGRSDDVLDETTGELKPAAPDSALIWEGAGAVTPLGRPMMAASLDDRIDPPTVATAYQALLPLAAPQIRLDDTVVVVGSIRAAGPRDPYLVGRRFRATEALTGTFAVVRVVRVELLG